MLARYVDAYTLKDVPKAGRKVEIPHRYKSGCPEIKTLRHKEQSHVPRLRSVTTAPTMTIDGRVIQTPGMDQATGIFFMPQAQYKQVSASPSQAEIAEAKAIVEGIFSGCNFDGPASKAAALSYAFTLAFAHSLRPVPLFLFASADEHAGKTTAVQIAQAAVCGKVVERDFPAERDLAKMLGDLTAKGAKYVLLDDADEGQEVASRLLSSLLTSQGLTDSDGGATMNPIIAATAKNPDTRRIVRRTILAQFLPRPASERGNVAIQAALGHRDSCWAVLTLLRAFFVAELPQPAKHEIKGSFEQWDRRVRACLIYLGYGDPDANQKLIQDLSDSDSAHHALMVQLWRAVQRQGGALTAAQLLAMAGGEQNDKTGDQELRAALLDAHPDKSEKFNAAYIGTTMRIYRDKKWRGCSIEAAKRCAGGRAWHVAGDFRAGFQAAGEELSSPLDEAPKPAPAEPKPAPARSPHAAGPDAFGPSTKLKPVELTDDEIAQEKDAHVSAAESAADLYDDLLSESEPEGEPISEQESGAET